jgi:hypothetical protein
MSAFFIKRLTGTAIIALFGTAISVAPTFAAGPKVSGGNGWLGIPEPSNAPTSAGPRWEWRYIFDPASPRNPYGREGEKTGRWVFVN